ncbi:MAG: peptidylprolyl isomerase [Candidatus Marinimicrobia bacterium]|nr:peptidylprolyl isomerase [Candidatus Neomarinimicrobiota bacterium]
MLKSVPVKSFSSLLILFQMAFSQSVVDGVAAIVGERVVLKSDVLQLAQMNAMQAGVDLTIETQLLPRFQDQALESLVTQKILLAMAAVDSMDEISRDEVDQALDYQIENLLSQFGSRERLELAMGQSMRDFKEEHWYDVRDQIIAERYQKDNISRVSISRPEVEAFFETYKDSLPPIDSRIEFAQLLIPILPGETSRSNAYAKAVKILEQIKSGGDFAQLAKDFSDDPMSAVQGGNLGFVRRGEFVAPFEQVAFSLMPGELSGLVETRYGYHIIQLLEKQGEKINARHILIALNSDESDRADALNVIRDYYFQLEEHPDLFDELTDSLAVEFGNRDKQGYFGWVDVSSLPGESYRAALLGTEAGDISPPFETNEGFHILKTLNYIEGGSPSLQKYYPHLELFALRQKQAEYFKQWLSSSRKSLFIDILE